MDYLKRVKILKVFKVSVYLIATLCILISGFSEETRAQSGRRASARRAFGVVKDSISGETLPFANIMSAENPKENTVTDENGSFRVSTKGSGEGWTVSYAGYVAKPLVFFDRDTAQIILLAPMEQNLSEVIVKPKKDRYSKKNNPAVDFVRRIRGNSKDNDPLRQPFYSYDKYEKTLIAVNDFKGDFESGFMGKKGKFLENYVDTSSWTGKRLLDMIVKEKSSVRLHSTHPDADKEIVKGYRSSGLDEALNQENIQVILEDAIREIDIYGNDIVFLQNRFVSPLSAIGPDFYKYYLTDTVIVNGDKCVELSFAPHNPESMGFNGKIFVPVGDTTMFVSKVVMRTPADINLNYVENVFINQRFEKDSLGNRHKTYDDVCLEMKIAPGTPGIYARKTTSYTGFSYEKRTDYSDYYSRLGWIFELEGARGHSGDFWEETRMAPLSGAESRMENLMGEMRKVPLFYWGEKFLSLMESGYVRTGNPSKFDFGPLNTLLSGGPVEGLRIRMGGMTMSALNPHLFAKGYLAYGTKDRRWKYRADLEYSFAGKKRHSYEWPRHGFYGSVGYDLDMIGQHYLFTSKDNVFLSFKRKESNLVTYRRHAEAGYILELPNNFSTELTLTHERQEATRWLQFKFRDGGYIPYYDLSSMKLSLRWAPGEKFVQGRTLRLPVNMDAWILQLTHEYGPKGFWGSRFSINKTEASVQKRAWLSAFGYVDLILKAGKIWSRVWYPALSWANSNLSYTIQPESFSLMNPMEFATDEYASVDFMYFGNGVLFNRLPLIKKLKMREVLTFKGLAGRLSDRNNPDLDPSLPVFPEDSHTVPMGRTPYMEAGVGLDNILTFLRVDYVWRLTYRNLPDIDRSGLRVSLHFSF